MNLVAVNSSNISKVGYEDKAEVLTVVFSNGVMYEYYDVPVEIYNELVEANSAGSYFSKNVRGFFSSAKVN